MSVQRDRPYPNSNFLVDLGDGVTDTSQAGLIEVVFPDARIQVVEYRNGNDKANDPHKITTQTEYGNLVLRRASHGSLNWYQWWNDIRNGDQQGFRTVVVQLRNEDHTQVVLVWKLLRARPVNHRFAPLVGHDNAALVETLELAFERLEME
jgi:phage tail-like protein